MQDLSSSFITKGIILLWLISLLKSYDILGGKTNTVTWSMTRDKTIFGGNVDPHIKGGLSYISFLKKRILATKCIRDSVTIL